MALCHSPVVSDGRDDDDDDYDGDDDCRLLPSALIRWRCRSSLIIMVIDVVEVSG